MPTPATSDGHRVLTAAASQPLMGKLVDAAWIAEHEQADPKPRLLEFAQSPSLPDVLRTYECWLTAVSSVDANRVSEYWRRLSSERSTHDSATAELALLHHQVKSGFSLTFWPANVSGPEWIAELNGKRLAVEVKRFTPEEPFGAEEGVVTGSVGSDIEEIVAEIEKRRLDAKKQLNAAKNSACTCLGVDLTERVSLAQMRNPMMEPFLREGLQPTLDQHTIPDMLVVFCVSVIHPELFGPPIVLCRQTKGARDGR